MPTMLSAGCSTLSTSGFHKHTRWVWAAGRLRMCPVTGAAARATLAALRATAACQTCGLRRGHGVRPAVRGVRVTSVHQGRSCRLWRAWPHVVASVLGAQDLRRRAARERWIICLPQPASITDGEGRVKLVADILGTWCSGGRWTPGCATPHVYVGCTRRLARPDPVAVFQARVPNDPRQERDVQQGWIHLHCSTLATAHCLVPHRPGLTDARLSRVAGDGRRSLAWMGLASRHVAR